MYFSFLFSFYYLFFFYLYFFGIACYVQMHFKGQFHGETFVGL